MSAIVLRGDARCLPLPDSSVDLIVTSPPYFGLRSYTDGGEHYDGQIGSEATPAEWLGNLLAATREWVRVLKPAGSIFVNLGDKYAGNNGGPSGSTYLEGIKFKAGSPRRTIPGNPKSLLGLPWRYALACTDQLGLILRRDIVWSKPNGLPESVTDRCRSSHEYVFHLVKQPRYYSAVDEIREPHSGPWKSPGSGNPAITAGPQSRNGHSQWERTRAERDATARHQLGKLPGSVWVWDIPSQPLQVPAHLGVDHFAVFPMELPRRCILGWSPPGVCTVCGQGRRPVTSVMNVEDRKGRKQRIVDLAMDGAHGPDGRGGERWKQTVAITGYACACAANLTVDAGAQVWPSDDRGQLPPTRPAVVLDPFAGTGTTMLVASALGRTGIGVDRSADYCRLAAWRCTDPAERAKAMQVPKPPPVPDGQAALFTL